MGRQKNDGRGRLGGRQKGTPNKITSLAKQMMEKWLQLHNSKLKPEDSQALIWDDFIALSPQDRVKVSLDFIKLILPRSVNIDDGDGNRILTIEDRLRQLAGEEDNDD